MIEKLSKLQNTVAAKYPGEEASLRKRIEEYKKLMDEKKRNEIAQAAIANGEVISNSDFEV